MGDGSFNILKMIGRIRNCVATAYEALEGMGDGAVEERRVSSGASGSIDDIVGNRVASDPLRRMRRRDSRPISDNEGIMRHIDIVSDGMNFPGRDTGGDLARYTRVCDLVENPYDRIDAEKTHICAIEELFAICVLEMISSPRADGLCEWETSLGGS